MNDWVYEKSVYWIPELELDDKPHIGVHYAVVVVQKSVWEDYSLTNMTKFRSGSNLGAYWQQARRGNTHERRR